MYGDLDEVSGLYRESLKKVSSLWMQAAQQGLCDGTLHRHVEEMQTKLENASAKLMDMMILLEKTRQEVVESKSALDISRQTVDAKWKHLGQEEKQKEEEQALKFKEFQRIKKLQEERDCLLRDVIPAKEKLARAMETLDEKSEKLRNLENFHDLLVEHCAMDIFTLKDRTDESRATRSRWDQPDIDLTNLVMTFSLDSVKLEELEKNVFALKEALYNHRQWYEEELHTKLFRATQSKEIKHRLTTLKNLLNTRADLTSGYEDPGEEERHDRQLSRRSEHFLVDGSPAVEAKEVERYLSQQFGMRVLADYTMLRRLKDEIGTQGLAYLVEKVRLQNSYSPFHQSKSNEQTQPLDWEEHRVQEALMAIAKEYRDSEENKRLFTMPICPQERARDAHSSVQSQLSYPETFDETGGFHPHRSSKPFGSYQTIRLDDIGTPLTAVRSSSSSQVTAHTGQIRSSRDASFDNSSRSAGQDSSAPGSMKRLNSLARIKKFLKL